MSALTDKFRALAERLCAKFGEGLTAQLVRLQRPGGFSWVEQTYGLASGIDVDAFVSSPLLESLERDTDGMQIETRGTIYIPATAGLAAPYVGQRGQMGAFRFHIQSVRALNAGDGTAAYEVIVEGGTQPWTGLGNPGDLDTETE